MEAKRVFRDSIFYVIGSVAESAIAFLLIPVYTTYLTTGQFGILELMNLTILLIGAVVSGPLCGALARFHHSPEFETRSDELLFNLLVVLVGKIVFLAGLFWLAGPWLCQWILGTDRYLSVVRMYSVVLMLTPLSAFLSVYIQWRQLAWYYVLVAVGRGVVMFGVVLWTLRNLDNGVEAVVWGYICSMGFLVLMFALVLLRRIKPRFNPSLLKKPLTIGYIQVFGEYSSIMIQSGDRFVLRAFMSLDMVGVYSLGYRMAGVLNLLVVSPLKMALTPWILKQEKNPDYQRSLIRKLSLPYLAWATLVGLVVSLWARSFVMLLGRQEAYWSAWVIIPLISLAYVQHGLGNLVGMGMVMKNKSVHISGTMLVVAGVNLLLNIVLVPFFGLMGAAVATVAAYFLWNCLKIHYSAKFYDLHFDIIRMVQIIVCAVAVYLAAYMLQGQCVWSNSLVNLAALVLYCLMVWPVVGSQFVAMVKSLRAHRKPLQDPR